MALTPDMLAKLHAKIIAEGKTFPCQLKLLINGELVQGFMYEDGQFIEGEETPSTGAVDAAA